MENLIHLFLHYGFASEIWNKVLRWLGLVSLVPPDLFISFQSLIGEGEGMCKISTCDLMLI